MVLAVAEGVPGAAKALLISLRAVTRDEQRGERGRANAFRAATREDWATVSELRTDVPPAYLLADLARLERMRPLGAFLRSGDVVQTAKDTGVPLRTFQRWVYEGPGSFLGFAAVYLSAKIKRARSRLVKDRAEFEARLESAREQCAEICNREHRGGGYYESAGGGCAACPLRVLNQAGFTRTESDGIVASRIAEIDRETKAWQAATNQEQNERRKALIEDRDWA